MKGVEHPDTADSYINIGVVYAEQGDYEKALEFFFKSLAIYEKVLGAEHPNTADSYYNIAIIYKGQGNYETALEYFQKSLAIYEKVLGCEHPNTRSCQENIEEAKAKLAEEETKKS